MGSRADLDRELRRFKIPFETFLAKIANQDVLESVAALIQPLLQRVANAHPFPAISGFDMEPT